MDIDNSVRGILEEGRYNYSGYSGCFDVVASRAGNFSPILLKVLSNIDSFQAGQANNLKILSSSIGAFAMLVGLNTRREKLDDGVFYERFEVTAMTPKTLENIVVRNEFPSLYRLRGGLFAEVSGERLRRSRERRGLTQKALAERAGITKKSVYEHEKKRMKIEYENAKRLERVLDCKLDVPAVLGETACAEKVKPTPFESSVSGTLRRIGFATEFVQQSPFNIIAKERFVLFLDAAERRRLEKDAPYLECFAGVLKKPIAAVTMEETSLDLPTIEESELRELRTARELERLVKRR